MADSSILRPEMPSVNPQVLQAAQMLLKEVQAGHVQSLAIVSISPLGQMTHFATGSQAEAIYICLDLLKSQILTSLTGQRPGIVGIRQ